jgi:anaerobic ribonucleoside-triphosphate reductase
MGFEYKANTIEEVQKMKAIPVEVFSRVVGYYRPVSQWNKGKKEEFIQRKEADVNSLTVKQ